MLALGLGTVIAEGTPAEVLDHPRVVESYLGTDATAIALRRGVAGPGAGRALVASRQPGRYSATGIGVVDS